MSPLPTQKTARRLNIADQTIFLYGKPKLGKTSWCAGAEDILFLATEPGLKGLTVYEEPIDSWAKFKEKCREIAAGGHPFKTVAIDTIDNLWKFCVDDVCQRHGVEHQADVGYGKGYDLIGGAFHRVLTKLCQMPYGVIMVSHAEEREIETPTGKIMRTTPTIPARAQKIVLGMADMILFYDIGFKTVDDKRVATHVLRTRTSERYEAGDRTGCLPGTIDLGDDPAQSYARFLAAYVKGGGSAGGGGPLAPTGETSKTFDDEAPAQPEAPPLPTDSQAPPPPEGAPTAVTPAERLGRVRASLASATSTAEYSQVLADAKKTLSKSELESMRGEFSDRKRSLVAPEAVAP